MLIVNHVNRHMEAIQFHICQDKGVRALPRHGRYAPPYSRCHDHMFILLHTA